MDGKCVLEKNVLFLRLIHFEMMDVNKEMMIKKNIPFGRVAQPFNTVCRRSAPWPLPSSADPSLSSVSLPALLSLHIYKAVCFSCHRTGKHFEFQPGGLKWSCWPVVQHFLFISWLPILSPITLFWSVVLIHFQKNATFCLDFFSFFFVFFFFF